ncbi:MAG: hypothetical protein ACLQBY_11535 [Solirubrobacteraceae bacterium]
MDAHVSPIPMPQATPRIDTRRARRSRFRRSISRLAVGAVVLALTLLLAPSAAAGQAPHARRTAHQRHARRTRAATPATKPSKHTRAPKGCAKGCVAPTQRSSPRNRPAGGAASAPTPPAAKSSPGEPSAPSRSRGEARGEGNLAAETGEVVSDPIDPRFLTDVPFGASSFWIQPWRAYLDTWPASRLLDSLGINFNDVNPILGEDAAQLLQDSGFTLARKEIPWDSLSYSDPSAFRNESRIESALSTLHKHGLRPLIVLNANAQDPGPSKHVELQTVSEAPAGARTVTLSAASAAEVVPGKTAFNGLTFKGPDILITAVGVADGATLSKPLPAALPAGIHGGTTLRYAPFARPTLPDGQPNPAFQETLRGWLAYVAAVCRKAASVVGPEGYDLEIWNELGFGSQFLNAEHYYSPPAEAGPQLVEAQQDGSSTQAGEDVEVEGDESEAGEDVEAEPEPPSSDAQAASSEAATPSKREVTKAVIKALLDETVAYVRNPANGIPPGVGITNGFASQTPFPSGALAPLGLTALSKHPYAGLQRFPAEYNKRNIAPINALGAKDAHGGTQAPFIPSYDSLFPEVTLTATHTETLIRDIAPITTTIYGLPHGREVGPVGGGPVQKWITEYNLGVGGATPVGPDEVTPATGAAAVTTSADRAHFHAKVALRSLVANVSKGISREYFYRASPGPLSLIGEGFFTAAGADPGVYPGDALGGETMRGLRNMLARFQGPGPEGSARQLTLLSIGQDGDHAQFAGDGTAAHPPLYDRDVLAVFPFQSSPTRFVIPVYVMTRDLLTLYEPEAPATDIGRFDLPNETFRITLGDLPESKTPPSVSAYDPLREESTPARLLSREGSTAVFEFAATDYPRILTIDYAGG